MSPIKPPAANVPCQPEWIEADKFYWYCGKSVPDPVRLQGGKVLNIVEGAQVCRHSTCLFKKAL